jgi:hypothetical protein
LVVELANVRRPQSDELCDVTPTGRPSRGVEASATTTPQHQLDVVAQQRAIDVAVHHGSHPSVRIGGGRKACHRRSW